MDEIAGKTAQITGRRLLDLGDRVRFWAVALVEISVAREMRAAVGLQVLVTLVRLMVSPAFLPCGDRTWSRKRLGLNVGCVSWLLVGGCVVWWLLIGGVLCAPAPSNVTV